MRHILLAVLGLALPAGGAEAEIAQVVTPHGTARIEGTTRYPEVERLMVGDKVVVEPDPDSAQQRVWIAAKLGDVLLVGLGSTGSGCYDGYVFVHTAAGEDLRTSDQFGTCGGDLLATVEGKTIRVSMDSMNPMRDGLNMSMTARRLLSASWASRSRTSRRPQARGTGSGGIPENSSNMRTGTSHL